MVVHRTPPAEETLPPAEALLGAELRHLPLHEIYVGGNYRTSINPEGLAELAESIRHSGLIQPITVRPLAEPIEGLHYALVAGARRHAAHQLAELATILCNVREMSAEQGDEARLIENLQRENPHPADEAQGVARLSAGGASSQDIASRLGKSLRWVAQRRAISELGPVWFEALRTDKLSLSAAEELARWPQDVQQRLLETATNHGPQQISENTVKHWLRSEARILSSAPWSLEDAELVPAAGACVNCPKRSSCAGLLFEVPQPGKDTCLDSGCWAKKLRACTEQALEQNSTPEQPARRIAAYNYQAPAGALTPDKYEVSKKKTGTVPAVYVDGPQQGKVVRIVVHVAATPEKSRGEQNKESRRTRLTHEATKRVIARRAGALLAQADEAGAEARCQLLAQAVVDQLQRNRQGVEDPLLLAALVAQWQWQQPTMPAYGSGDTQQVLREQVRQVAPTEATLAQLLCFVMVHKNLGYEFDNYQHKVATLLGDEAMREGLADAAQAQLAAEYDPQTLRARKPAAK